MLNYKCLLCFAFVFFITYASGQKNNEPYYNFSKLQEEYPDDKQVAASSFVKITFEIDKNTGNPVAYENVSEKVISIDEYANTFRNAIFYDETSNVLSLKQKSGKKASDIPKIISDYESDGIFHNDVKICAFEKTFSEKGQSFNYTYAKKYNDLKYLTKVFFHENYPILERKVIIDVPEWITIEILPFNFEAYQIEVSKSEIENGTRFTYEIEDIGGFASENGAPNISHIYPHILILTKKYVNDGKEKNVLSSTDDLYNWYRQLVEDVDNKTEDIEGLVEQLTGHLTSDIDKVKAIFYWVQDNVRYIAFENGIMGFQPASCQDVFNKKYGDCKGMANLAKEMLKHAGFDARLTWLGTSDLPYDYSIPSLAVDNHMICTVILDGKRYFLDPTEEYIEFGSYAHRIQGSQVLIEDGDNYQLDNIPVLPADHNKTVTRMKLNIGDDTIDGSVKVRLSGESKTRFLRILSGIESDVKEEAIQYYLKSGEKNVKVSDISTSDLRDRDGELSLDYDVRIENQITAIGSEVYCNFDTEKDFAEMIFEDDRKLPYEFSKKLFLDYEAEFDKPSGWNVDYFPEAVKVKEDGYEFMLRLHEEAGKILYTKKIIIKKAELSTNDMSKWNGYIKQLNEFYNDQLILVKP